MAAPRQLTPDQQRAVKSNDSAVLLIAPAGSGKTEVLIRRVIRILNETRGESFRILAVTFTVKAADELRQRVDRMVGEEAWRVDADTIHGFALDWLRQYGESVGVLHNVVVYADKVDRLDLLRQYLEMLGELPSSKELEEILESLDELRTNLVEPEEVEPTQLAPGSSLQLRDVYEAYVLSLETANAVDFPALLTKFLDLLATDPAVLPRFRRTYRHMFIDEGQDLTRAQAELLKRLVINAVNVFIVADDRQSIQGWAGGSIEWARYLVGPAASVLRLEHNFRCATQILDLARQVARNLSTPRSDASPPQGAPPGSVEVARAESDAHEASLVAEWIVELLQGGLPAGILVPGESPSIDPEEIAVIARTRFLLDPITQALSERNTPLSIRTGADSFLVTPEARLLHATLELRVNRRNKPAWRKATEELRGLHLDATKDSSLPETGPDLAELVSTLTGSAVEPLIKTAAVLEDSASGLEKLAEAIANISVETPGWERDQGNLLSWWHQYRSATREYDRSLEGWLLHLFKVQRTRPDDPGVRLLTTHRAKGMEFRAVAVVGLSQGEFPHYRSIDKPSALDEERRAFYVAVTRASRTLLLTWPERRTTRSGNVIYKEPSQFLFEGRLLPNR